jgi:thioredoxin-dependent peroxiredoxin
MKVGDHIPSFSLPNQDGVMVNIDDIKRGRNLVLYFYPKDDTIVCTREACGFRDNYSRFEKLDSEIVGISSDSPKSHHKFATRHYLPFVLLSDEQNKVRKLLGVPRDLLGLVSGRYSYVIDKNGVIVHIFSNHLSASRHITESLKALENEQRSNQ